MPWLALAVVAVIGVVVMTTALPPSVRFAAFSLETFSTALVPLLVIAVLIERTIEVFFGIAREPRERELEHKKENADRAGLLLQQGADDFQVRAHLASAAAIRVHPDTADALGATGGPGDSRLALDAGATRLEPAVIAQHAAAAHELNRFKMQSTRIAFYASLFLGVIAAIAGIRVLDLLLASDPPAGAEAGTAPALPPLFQLLNVLLTAGLLAGGADGFHHVTSVVQEFLGALKDRSKALADPALR